ncbi:hypothetical protein JCM14467A_21540 [Vulcanisaeta sp. JCM 14467]
MKQKANTMKRIKLSLANQQVEFVDREQALKRIEEWVSRGVAFPQVVYGPEGCGKTAWLRQSAELLRELGFDVIYVNPIEKEFMAELGIQRLKDKLTSLAREVTSQLAWVRVTWSVIDIVREAIRLGRGKIAIIIDDAFQVIGLDNAAIYVKGLLGILEHPPEPYERVIAIAATSESVSRREIGRHEWADIRPIWNMSKEGFKQLYDQLPGNKPDFEEVWRLTGGNPRMLERLYESRWKLNAVIDELINRKELTHDFVRKWLSHLREAVSDPDYLWYNAPEELIDELIEKNLIMYFLPERDQWFWIDAPPPERDPELGIGKYVAWQTPIHREAIRRVLESSRRS